MTEPALVIPDAYAAQIIAWQGERGHRWLEGLPALAAACAERWRLTLGPPLQPLSYNYVARAERADGARAVLKIGLPDAELAAEIAALRHFDARGCVRLLEGDAELGALLLERLEPGTPIAALDDEQATRIAAQTLRQLWRPPPDGHPFPTLARWTRGLDDYLERFPDAGPLPAALVRRAIALRDALVASTTREVVLHGDLHHDNILAGRGEWLAIDPKGVVGDPVYDTGPYQYNPIPRFSQQPDVRRIMRRRIAQFADELELDPARIWAWGFVQAMLSVCWSAEDGSSYAALAPVLACAEHLLAIAP